MTRTRLATVWLDGCSGCHMSFLDIDERLLALAEKIDLVYSPLVDTKEFPEWVDVTLVEGAVSNQDDIARVRNIRAHTKVLVSLGDCAVTGNIPSMRDPFPLAEVLARLYHENASLNKMVPRRSLPPLLDRVRPVHEFVNVDVFVPGCPPSADNIFFVLSELIEGRIPSTSFVTWFGA